MPVFLLLDGMPVHHAVHPDHPGPLPTASSPPADDALLRVGTAIKREDGGYLIELRALPVNGTLLMRPPGPSDQRDLPGGRVR